MDEAAFTRATEAHRRALFAHCYRMLGAAPDAEDATQDAMLKAWEARGSLASETSLRPWLYRIATNVCLDLLAKRGPRVLAHQAFPPADSGTPPRPFLEEAIWVGPAPDEAFEGAERVTLALVAALQHLPARQRAALLLRDVVELSARETADALDSNAAAVEAALQRARITMSKRADDAEASAASTVDPDLLDRYVAAWHARDASALVSLLSTDASFVMPPTPIWFQGRDAVVAFVRARLAENAFLLVPTRANGLPAFALYRAHPEGGHVAHGIQVLEARNGAIDAIHTFLATKDDRAFRLFGLPIRRPAV